MEIVLTSPNTKAARQQDQHVSSISASAKSRPDAADPADPADAADPADPADVADPADPADPADVADPADAADAADVADPADAADRHSHIPVKMPSEQNQGVVMANNEETREKAIEEFLAPHKHSPSELWKRARPESKKIYEKLVADGQLAAELAIQAALGVVVAGNWPTIDDCIPPGSLLESVDAIFLENTDIPRALPFAAVLHYISAFLLQRGVQIDFAEERVKPDIWSICLAESGAGKSFSQASIEKALGSKVELFPDFASAVVFVENLKNHNRGLWLRDEFAQFLKALNEDKMIAVRDYLLRAYGGSSITYAVKGTSVTIDDPALTIFGSTVFETLKDSLDKESLKDGFAQRFAYIVADREPDRKLRGIYKVKRKMQSAATKWNEIESSKLHFFYSVSPVSEAAFEQTFQMLVSRSGSLNVPVSFVRRVSFRAVKYALIYHVILGKSTDYLDEEDFTYAAKLCAINLRDARKVLDLYEKPSSSSTAIPDAHLAKLIGRLGKLRDENLPPTTTRDLQANIKIKKTEMLALIAEAVAKDPSLAPFVKL